MGTRMPKVNHRKVRTAMCSRRTGSWYGDFHVAWGVGLQGFGSVDLRAYIGDVVSAQGETLGVGTLGILRTTVCHKTSTELSGT